MLLDGFIIICYKFKDKRRRKGVKSVKKMAVVDITLRKIPCLKEGNYYEITLLAIIKRKTIIKRAKTAFWASNSGSTGHIINHLPTRPVHIIVFFLFENNN